MSENVFGASYIKDNANLFKNVEDLVYGRVINVLFSRKNGGKTFTIRSDYEPVFHKDGTMEFTECTQKPSMKLKYNQVSNNTAIEIELRVDALFIDREAVGEEIDSTDGNPVMWMLIQVGYIGQFPDWRKFNSTGDLERFYELNNNMVTSDVGVKGGSQILVQVLTAYPVSNPPERVWVFNGVVGTLANGLRWTHDIGSLTAGYGDPNFPGGLSEIEMLLYQWITRRYVRAGVMHMSTEVEEKDADGKTKKDDKGNSVYTQVVTIKGYKKYFDNTITDNEWTDLTLTTQGLMSFSDANTFGVICACSKSLKLMSLHALFRYGTVGGKASFVKADDNAFDTPMNGIGPQLQAIRAHYQYLRWYMLTDGNIFFYHVNDRPEDIFSDPFVKTRQVSKGRVLPAVYDITMSGMRTIQCPFFSFVNPMDTVFFQSRYHILDTTGFYYQPKKGMCAFLVILSELEFSTTGDENTMVLTCDDISTKETPMLDVETGVITPAPYEDVTSTYTTNVEEQQRERNLKWAQATLKCGAYPFDKVSTKWIDIAKNFLFANADPADWDEGQMTLARALGDLKEWNLDGVWNNSRMTSAEGSSPENKLCPEAMIQIPWLQENDIVKFRYPYKQFYDSEYEEKEIKVNE